MSPILRRGRGRHRKTWWDRWKRRKKLPSSFPLIGMGIAVLIGITVMGFILSPGGPDSPSDTRSPYSASPSQEGTGTDRVTPETTSTPPNPTASECTGIDLPIVGCVL